MLAIFKVILLPGDQVLYRAGLIGEARMLIEDVPVAGRADQVVRVGRSG